MIWGVVLLLKRKGDVMRVQIASECDGHTFRIRGTSQSWLDIKILAMEHDSTLYIYLELLDLRIAAFSRFRAGTMLLLSIT